MEANIGNNTNEKTTLLRSTPSTNNNNTSRRRFQDNYADLSIQSNDSEYHCFNDFGSCTCKLFIGLVVMILVCLIAYRSLFLVDPITNSGDFSLDSILKSDKQTINKREDETLLMVNAFIRHGDRAPLKLNFFGLDKLEDKVETIWPEGLLQITDNGKLRMFRLGLELSRRYRASLKAHSSDAMLALSSDLDRCIDSSKYLIRAFYNFEWTSDEGLNQIKAQPHCSENSRLSDSHYCRSLSDVGWPDEWKRVKIDKNSLKSLRARYPRDTCPGRFMKSDCSIATNLDNDPRLNTVTGYDKLKKIAFKNGLRFNYTFAGLYPEIISVLRMAQYKPIYEILKQQAYWMTHVVASRGHRTMTLLDSLERLNILSDTICEYENSIGIMQLGPIFSHMLESQRSLARFNQSNNDQDVGTSKKIVLYNTHDLILELMLEALSIRRIFEEPFEKKFFSLNDEENEIEAVVSGIRRPELGATLIFELWQTNSGFKYVKLVGYSAEEINFDRIKFKPIQLGLACRRLYSKKFMNQSIGQYYIGAPNTFNYLQDCPFDLWQVLVKTLTIDKQKFNDLCEGKDLAN